MSRHLIKIDFSGNELEIDDEDSGSDLNDEETRDIGIECTWIMHN